MADLAARRRAAPPSRWIAARSAAAAALARRALVGVLVLVALLAPLLAPHDPLEQDLLSAQLPPSWSPGGDPAYLLRHRQPRPRRAVAPDLSARDRGDRRAGRGLARRADRLALGLIAGSFGGWVDQVISRLIDVWMSFPPVLLSIVLAAVIGAGLTSVIVAIVVVDWTRFARVVRAETMVQLAARLRRRRARHRAEPRRSCCGWRSCPTSCRCW